MVGSMRTFVTDWLTDWLLNLKNSHQTMPFGLIEIEDGGREQMTHVIQEGKESE